MRREDIEKLLKDNGVADEKIKATVDMVMAENGKDIEAEKAKTTAKEGELTKANETVKGLQDSIKKFDGVDIDKLQEDAKNLQSKYDTDIKAAQSAADMLRKEFGLKESLRNARVLDPDYLIFKHGGVDKFTFDGEGKPIGVEAVIKPYKESLSHVFKTETTQIKYNPNAGEGNKGSNPWVKESFNLTEQGKIYKDSPEQARSMMAAAGLQI